jgi:hypothetical protein
MIQSDSINKETPASKTNKQDAIGTTEQPVDGQAQEATAAMEWW